MGFVQSVFEQYHGEVVRTSSFLGVFLVVSLVGHFLVRPAVSRAIRARNKNNPTLVHAIEQYVTVLAVVIGTILGTVAAGFGGVLAGSSLVVAAATLALGVAGQDVIGNLVSGLFLVLDPDFNVDDYIEWDGESGTVERIDLRVTRVRTAADEVLTVPNTQLATNAIRNPFSRDSYRITVPLYVGYDTDIEEVTEIVRTAALEDDRLSAHPSPAVRVTELGENAIQLSAWAWMTDPRNTSAVEVRSAFAARVKDALQSAGVTVAPASAQELSGTVTVENE